MKYCSFCEESREDEMEDCPICGLPLEERQEEDSRPPPAEVSDISVSGRVEPPEGGEEEEDEPERSSKTVLSQQAEPRLVNEPDTDPEPEIDEPSRADHDDWSSEAEATAAAYESFDSSVRGQHEDPEPEPPKRAFDPADDPFADQVRAFGEAAEADVPEQSTESEARDRSVEEPNEKALQEVIAKVNEHLRLGFDLFGLVGHASSGKTHALKALTYLLKKHGVDGEAPRMQFHKTAAPESTRRKIFDFAYMGPAGERWVFVDAGGELYLRLHENDWQEMTAEMTALSRWLQSCKGLLFFLHLNEHHFGRGAIDDSFVSDEQARTRRERALQAQEQLAFFRSFLLFVRALRFEKGGLRKLILRCQENVSLEKALMEYHQRAPLLDIPVMFFFSQADSYLQNGFYVGPSEPFSPRSLSNPSGVAPFVAQHLPGLFADIAAQVKRFKFDFLQSYEEVDSGEVDINGRPIKMPVWEADPQTPLSVSLLAGLEFILRNQPPKKAQDKSFWRSPGISTLQALSLHRLLHPKQWRHVSLSLRHIELTGGGRL